MLLAAALLLLTVYSVIQNNTALFQLEHSRFFALKLLDTASAASLFVTVIGALLVRNQFALSVFPRINYKSTRTERYNKLNPKEPFETWRVEIRNTGLGAAIINRSDYSLETDGVENKIRHCNFEHLIKELAAIDLIADRDYWIENIASGFSLTPKDDCFVFEIKMEHAKRIKSLEMVLYFQSQLGDRYSREIILIRHHEHFKLYAQPLFTS